MTMNSETPNAYPPKRLRPASSKLLVAGVASVVVALAVGGGVYAQSANKDAPLAQASVGQQNNIGAPGFADLVEQVRSAVVSVRVKIDEGQQSADANGGAMEQFNGTPKQPFRKFGSQGSDGQRFGDSSNAPHQFAQALGSGFFISPDGYLVTNNHVVDKAVKVQIIMDDGTMHDAKVIGTDPMTDLALLKVEDGKNFPYVKLADKEPRIGDWVIAMGNPFGLGGTVTAGIVSAEGRDIGSGPYDDYIQIDASVNEGNSGGPTFNLKGEVTGVNTAILSPSEGSVGIAFDIPAATVKAVVSQLQASGRVERGWLGVQVQPVTPEIADSLDLPAVAGALIAEPQPDSPATKAGLRSGDVITRVDGKQVEDSRDFARQIAALPPNTNVVLTVTRDGSERTIDLRLGQLKDEAVRNASVESDSSDATSGKLGIEVAPASKIVGAGETGLAVVDVDPNGQAAEFGLRQGDIILKSAGKTINSASELKASIAAVKAAGKNDVLVLIKRDATQLFISLPVAG